MTDRLIPESAVIAAIEGQRFTDDTSHPCVTGYNSAINTAIEAVQALPDAWRPIEEAPKDGTIVLLWTDTRLCVDANKFEDWGCEHLQAVQIGYWEDDVDAPLRKEAAGWRCEYSGMPTHFMPLPTPPETNDGKVAR